jgi:hypothetical protein
MFIPQELDSRATLLSSHRLVKNIVVEMNSGLESVRFGP